jgi:hypothetical protein
VEGTIDRSISKRFVGGGMSSGYGNNLLGHSIKEISVTKICWDAYLKKEKPIAQILKGFDCSYILWKLDPNEEGQSPLGKYQKVGINPYDESWTWQRRLGYRMSIQVGEKSRMHWISTYSSTE